MLTSAEADEQRDRPKRNAVISFEAFEHAYDAIEPLDYGSFPPVGIVRGNKGGNRSLSDQRLRFAMTFCEGLKATVDLPFEIDAQLGFFS